MFFEWQVIILDYFFTIVLVIFSCESIIQKIILDELDKEDIFKVPDIAFPKCSFLHFHILE